jgi:DNA invertase Pin-like site-specific DNA recombinase
LQLLGVFAEFERERFRERSQDGHHRLAREGGFVGSTPPFGYRAVPDPAGAAGFVLAIDPPRPRASGTCTGCSCTTACP